MPRKKSPGVARAPSQRQLRVGELLRHALSELFARGEVRDPALADVTITITEVTIGSDLRHAVAYVMPLAGTDAGPTLEALERSRGFIRGRIAHMVDLRHAPEISFRLDTSFEYSEEVRRLLSSPRVRADLEPNESGPDDDDSGKSD